MLQAFSRSFEAMGCPCSLHFYTASDSVAQHGEACAVAEVERIEQAYSRYRSDSVLSRINRVAAQGGELEVDEETAALLDYAYSCHRLSDGLFDISAGVLRRAWDFSAAALPSATQIAALGPLIGLSRVIWRRPRLGFTRAGMELDFGGLAKEYAADRAAGMLAACGIAHGLVELGGDIRVIGPHPDGEPWAIGIRHPRRGDALCAHAYLYSGGLAGSGDYARAMVVDGVRYSHILNPHNGWPVKDGLSAVNVHADSCMVAGSVASIAMLKGGAAVTWLQGVAAPHIWLDQALTLGGRWDGVFVAG